MELDLDVNSAGAIGGGYLLVLLVNGGNCYRRGLNSKAGNV